MAPVVTTIRPNFIVFDCHFPLQMIDRFRSVLAGILVRLHLCRQPLVNVFLFTIFIDRSTSEVLKWQRTTADMGARRHGQGAGHLLPPPAEKVVKYFGALVMTLNVQ